MCVTMLYMKESCVKEFMCERLCVKGCVCVKKLCVEVRAFKFVRERDVCVTKLRGKSSVVKFV